MAYHAADGVKVQWTGTGTATVSLGSAASGWQGFPAALNGAKVSYSIEHENGLEREAGRGTYTSAGNTLSRDLVTFSTANAPNKQSFTAGNKVVRLTPLAHDLIENRATTDPGVTSDSNAGYIAGRSRWLNTSTGALWFCVADTVGAAQWRTITDHNGGTFNPAAINLSRTAGFADYAQAGAITLALSGSVNHVAGCTATVRVDGNGANVAVDGVTVFWADGTTAAKTWTDVRTLALWYHPALGIALAFVPGGAASGGTWGTIGGTLSSQTDLQSTLDGKLGLSGGTLTGQLNPVGVKIPTGTVSGTLTMATHSNGCFITSGNITIPNTAGFIVTLLADTSRTVNAGGAAMNIATGDMVTVIVFAAGNVKYIHQPAAALGTLATS